MQVLVCLAMYAAIHYICRLCRRRFVERYPDRVLTALLLRNAVPNLLFAGLFYAVIHYSPASDVLHRLLFTKEITTVAGMIGFIRLGMWLLRDVMKPHDLLCLLLTVIEWTLFCMVALLTMGLYEAVMDTIASIQFTVGSQVIKGGNIVGGSIFAVMAYTVAGQTARLIDIGLERYSKNRPMHHNDLIVMSRTFHMIIFTVVTLSVLISLGIEGSNLAAFAGALGIGLGFGLQEVVMNLVSGVFILFEGSVKHGDYVTINGITGKIKALNTRSAIVEDDEGVQNLIPNSLITKEVLKSHPLNRDNYRFSFPVALENLYDFEKAKALILVELKKHERILDDKPQDVFVKGVKEQLVKIEVSCWLNNVDRNYRQLLSDLYLGISLALQAHEIRFSCNEPHNAIVDFDKEAPTKHAEVSLPTYARYATYASKG